MGVIPIVRSPRKMHYFVQDVCEIPNADHQTEDRLDDMSLKVSVTILLEI